MESKINKGADALKHFEHFDHLPDNARVRLPVLTLLFSCSPATAWRRVRDGRLPAPRKDGRMTYWLAGELRAKLREGAE